MRGALFHDRKCNPRLRRGKAWIKLTDWLVEQRRLGVESPEIGTNTIKHVENNHPRTVFERADDLLRFLDQRGERIGVVFKFYQLDNERVQDFVYEILAWTSSEVISEVITLIEYCAEKNWIHHKVTYRTSGDNTLHEIQLKPAGYARIAELAGDVNELDKSIRSNVVRSKDE